MRMRVDAAGHDVTAARIERFVARQVRADLDDLSALDLDVRLVGQVGRDDGSTLDDSAH
ncbi:hypothetical protein D3C71_1837920 [compost metagenome]